MRIPSLALMACVGFALAMLFSVPLFAQQQVVVDIREFAFEPRDTRITAGMSVRWINHDDVPHQVGMEGGRPGSSGLIAPGTSYTFTFGEAGRFTYRCGVHPTMLGLLIVDSP